jgi:O-antigen/teichoic acid export membrane protein
METTGTVRQSSFAHDAFKLLTGRYAAAAVSVATTVIAARGLGPIEFGIAAVAMAYPGLIWSVCDVKSVAVTSRYIAGFWATGRIAEIGRMCRLGYAIDLAISLLSMLIVVMTASWIEDVLLRRGETGWLAIAFAASLVVSSLRSTSTAVLAGLNRFGDLAVLEFIERILALVAVAVLLLVGFSAAGFVIGLATAQSAAGFMMATIAQRRMAAAGVPNWWQSRGHAELKIPAEVVRLFGWNYVIVTVSGIVTHLPLTLLGYVRGVEEAGFYRLATSIGNTAANVESALGRIAHSHLSVDVLARQVCWGELRGKVRLWTFQFGVPLALVVAATIPLLSPIVRFLFGSDYQPMVSAGRVMLVASAIGTALFWLLPLYYAFGQLKAWSTVYVVYGLLGVSVGILMAREWGVWGVSLAIVTARILFLATMLVIAPRVARGQA